MILMFIRPFGPMTPEGDMNRKLGPYTESHYTLDKVYGPSALSKSFGPELGGLFKKALVKKWEALDFATSSNHSFCKALWKGTEFRDQFLNFLAGSRRLLSLRCLRNSFTIATWNPKFGVATVGSSFLLRCPDFYPVAPIS